MCQKKGGGTVSGFLGGIFLNLQAEGIYPSFCEEENIKCFVAGALPGLRRPLRVPVALRGLVSKSHLVTFGLTQTHR